MYSDWVEKEGTRKKDKKALIQPPPDMQAEFRDREEKKGTRRQVDFTFKGEQCGRILEKKGWMGGEGNRKRRRNGDDFENDEVDEYEKKWALSSVGYVVGIILKLSGTYICHTLIWKLPQKEIMTAR